MFGKLLILAAAVFGYFWLKSWYFNLKKEDRKKATWNLAVGALIAVMLFAFLTGRMHWAGLAFALVLGATKFLVSNAIRFAPMFMSVARKHNFSTPEIHTRYLNVKLHLGQKVVLEGNVIDGPHAGKNLNQLKNDELLELANFYKDKCKRSYYLILVLLQNAGNQHQYQHQSVEDTSSISRNEAIQILGLDANFSDEDVKLAHRRLIQKLHPDKGGNAWLASRINLAKDTLLHK